MIAGGFGSENVDMSNVNESEKLSRRKTKVSYCLEVDLNRVSRHLR